MQKGRSYEDYRWSRFKHFAPAEMFTLIVDHLTEHGVMEPTRLYESPFTDIAPYGPDGLFPSVDIDALLQVLDGVRATASEAA